MRSHILKYFILAAFLLVMLTPVANVVAYNPFSSVDCKGTASSSAVCNSDGGNPLTGPDGILLKATELIAIVAGVTAVVIIIIAGIRFITSNGAADQIAKARKTIIYAAIGLVVIFFSQAIISYIISRI